MLLAPVPVLFYALLSQKLAPAEKIAQIYLPRLPLFTSLSGSRVNFTLSSFTGKDWIWLCQGKISWSISEVSENHLGIGNGIPPSFWWSTDTVNDSLPSCLRKWEFTILCWNPSTRFLRPLLPLMHWTLRAALSKEVGGAGGGRGVGWRQGSLFVLFPPFSGN